MNIYTRGGDRGTTSLIQSKNLSKSDDRINLVGTIDELTSQLGVVKTMLRDSRTLEQIESIQRTLIQVMAGVADPYKREYHIPDAPTEELEREIDRLEALFERPKEFILPGGSPLSARIDVARTVCRRAERALALVSVRFGADNGSKKYMNRLADYLYILARYQDACAGEMDPRPASQTGGQKNAPLFRHGNDENTAADRDMIYSDKGNERKTISDKDADRLRDEVIREVLRRMNTPDVITLDMAKRLIERIEEEAKRRGTNAVIAICNPQGNPVAVHVMDGAYLVSFDVALKKAYTSVAVKMSTMELSRLAQPGQTFYGVDKLDGGRIVIFGGGIPLEADGRIIGGLGISGGTGEEDDSLARYGLSVLKEV